MTAEASGLGPSGVRRFVELVRSLSGGKRVSKDLYLHKDHPSAQQLLKSLEGDITCPTDANVIRVGGSGATPTVSFLHYASFFDDPFARLPRPDPHDLFFDLEGDPLHPDGLEYLWGVHYRDGKTAAQFKFTWAHDRAGERAAFEQIVDCFTDHVAQHPGAHIYHYASYEVSALRRLSTAFASRENAVDDLLRGEKFVDLYAIVRAAVRTSEPDLSLKTLEIFFAEQRIAFDKPCFSKRSCVRSSHPTVST